MSTHMDITDFSELLTAITGPRPINIRPGQHAFNCLYDRHPEIANEIRASKVDPFHRDDLLKDFLIYILRTYVESVSN